MSWPAFPARRGDSFALAGTCRLPSGPWAARCQARRATGGAGVWDLAVTLGPVVDDDSTPIVIEAAATLTATWPVGRLESDVLFTDPASGQAVHSGRFFIEVADVVTR